MGWGGTVAAATLEFQKRTMGNPRAVCQDWFVKNRSSLREKTSVLKRECQGAANLPLYINKVSRRVQHVSGKAYGPQ
jgi:hypothetical protein